MGHTNTEIVQFGGGRLVNIDCTLDGCRIITDTLGACQRDITCRKAADDRIGTHGTNQIDLRYVGNLTAMPILIGQQQVIRITLRCYKRSGTDRKRLILCSFFENRNIQKAQEVTVRCTQRNLNGSAVGCADRRHIGCAIVIHRGRGRLCQTIAVHNVVRGHV